MTEEQYAPILANKILDRANADPDDDLAILARQLLRTHERLAQFNGCRSQELVRIVLPTHGSGG